MSNSVLEEVYLRIFSVTFLQYMYIVVTIISQPTTLRAVDTTGTPQRPWTRAQNEPKIILGRNIGDICSGWAPKSLCGENSLFSPRDHIENICPYQSISKREPDRVGCCDLFWFYPAIRTGFQAGTLRCTSARDSSAFFLVGLPRRVHGYCPGGQTKTNVFVFVVQAIWKKHKQHGAAD